MTQRDRDRLKQLVDQAVRAKTRPDLEQNRCRGCGVEYDVFSPGCRPCQWRRHSQKRHRQKPRSRQCAQCGGDINNRTTGCKTCRERFYARVKRANRARRDYLREEQLARRAA